MAKLTDREFEAALELGSHLFDAIPHAQAVKYDGKNGRLIIDLSNNCIFTVPVRLLQGLEQASDEQIEAFDISGDGYGLHWHVLDVDFTVHGLLAGYFGTKAHMAKLTAQGIINAPQNRAA